MSEIKIDKNVPIPKNAHPGRTPKYPWIEMDVGDSFFIGQLSVSVSATNERYKPRKFISRKVGTGYRIWRVE